VEEVWKIHGSKGRGEVVEAMKHVIDQKVSGTVGEVPQMNPK
jgi:hypothetical protein